MSDLKTHLEALAELRNIAARKGQIAAAVAAEVARGKAMGLYQQEQGDKQAEFTEVFSQLIESLPG
ncbi:MAG: hypothetical protein L6271_01935 [Desulfobacteraceae bacterium]|nr:hypothetical protein [Pseudomonadota bacterium]MCG2742675.1 hypothetical protein [Desulfobacteraceae bacterium]